MTSRERYQQISDSLYEGNGLLMNSGFADLFVRDECVILLLVVLVGIYLKEKWLDQLSTKVITNSLGTIILGFFAGIMIQSLYIV